MKKPDPLGSKSITVAEYYADTAVRAGRPKVATRELVFADLAAGIPLDSVARRNGTSLERVFALWQTWAASRTGQRGPARDT